MIECKDALKVIRGSDSPDTFFYIDPPYFNADMGHYKGYAESDFNDLLDTLQGIKGKFLLSHYPCVNIDGRGWNTKEFNMILTSSATHGDHPTRKKTKTECLTYNYSFEGEAVNLFEGYEGKGEWEMDDTMRCCGTCEHVKYDWDDCDSEGLMNTCLKGYLEGEVVKEDICRNWVKNTWYIPRAGGGK
jgi:hypothetical protein